VTCPLCGAPEPSGSRFLNCSRCDLVFRPAKDRPSAEEERAHYLTHENSPEQEGYVRHLRRALDPALPYLEPGMKGVDWGSGPGPTLSGLLRATGFACHDYDPIFGPKALFPPYDFIFATECLEHMHHPGRDMEHLVSCLSPGGLFIAMTECWEQLSQFDSWRYARDPTHTSFFHRRTFVWIAAHFKMEHVWSDGRRVFILRRHAPIPRPYPAPSGTP